MRDLSELNLNDGGEPVTRRPPSDRIISKFEMTYGISLPKDYITLLKFSNGGHPELETFAPPGSPPLSEWGVSHFFFLNEDRDGVEGLWWNTEIWQGWLGREYIPFASEGGGNPFLFHYDGAAEPKVVGCLFDDRNRIIPLAPDFATFIDGLYLDPDLI